MAALCLYIWSLLNLRLSGGNCKKVWILQQVRLGLGLVHSLRFFALDLIVLSYTNNELLQLVIKIIWNAVRG